MSNLFHSIPVKEIIRETPDASTVVFDIPEALKSEFHYQPGQYITVRMEINGNEERRAYSFCSSPYTDANPAITVKKVADGRVSPRMNDVVKAGDFLQIMPPMGKFTVEPDPARKRHYVLFAGGSGITPVMSILKSVLHKEPESVVSLIYANRDTQSIIFAKSLETLQQEYEGRIRVIHCLEEAPAGFDGFIGRPAVPDYQKITRDVQLAGYPSEYYICGPGGMMEAVKNALTGLGVSGEHIHTEYFNAPIHDAPKTDGQTPEAEFTGEATATILFHGNEFEINVAEGQTVLEAAQEQDVDPPYACQMGVCTTCRARMMEGAVRMDEREGLSDAEIEAGYVLTCQSHPITAHIKLIYE